MSREEAIEVIRKEYACVDADCDIERNCGRCELHMPSKEPILKAYEMAIQALSQEPCNDAVSRQAVLALPRIKIHNEWGNVIKESVDVEDVKQLPSVTQKSGKWIVGRISPTKLRGENLIEYRCSECDRAIRCTESQLVNYPYCHCGAKMIEPQESEDKK